MKKPKSTEDQIRENEARVLTVGFVIMFAVSFGVWYLSTRYIGYWWTVLLSYVLGN